MNQNDKIISPGAVNYEQAQAHNIDIDGSVALDSAQLKAARRKDGAALDSAQLKAARHGAGPALVAAAPGSGKTRVIVSRVEYLTRTPGLARENVLVVTFSRAAAREMEARYKSSGKVTFGTFHSVFFGILRHEYNYTAKSIISSQKKQEIIRTEIRALNLSSDDEDELIGRILRAISVIKSQNIQFLSGGILKGEAFGRKPSKSFETAFSRMPFQIDCEFSDRISQEVGLKLLIPAWALKRIYVSYERNLRALHLVDFDDMLNLCLKLLETRPDVLSYWQNKFRYILVDEFQDINPLQYRILKMLAEPENNLFAVGDDDQSIYAFRGSNPGIMRQFLKDFPDAAYIELNTNYRSRPEIIKAAESVIAKNKGRLKKRTDIRSAYDTREERCKQTAREDTSVTRSAPYTRVKECAQIAREDTSGRQSKWDNKKYWETTIKQKNENPRKTTMKRKNTKLRETAVNPENIVSCLKFPDKSAELEWICREIKKLWGIKHFQESAAFTKSAEECNGKIGINSKDSAGTISINSKDSAGTISINSKVSAGTIGINSKDSAGTIAVLVRRKSEALKLTSYFIRHGIPFEFSGKIPNTFEHFIVKDILAYMRIAACYRGAGAVSGHTRFLKPDLVDLKKYGTRAAEIDTLRGRSPHSNNSEKPGNFSPRADWLRIINKPMRYISRELFRSSDKDFLEMLKRFYRKNPLMKEEIDRLEGHLKFLSGLPPLAAIKYIRGAIGYDRWLMNHAQENFDKSQHNELWDRKNIFRQYEYIFNQLEAVAKKSSNLREFEKYISDFSNTASVYTSEDVYKSTSAGKFTDKSETKPSNGSNFNQEAQSLLRGSQSAFSNINNFGSSVKIMTMHASKGLEFDTVFIPGVNEGNIPNLRALKGASTGFGGDRQNLNDSGGASRSLKGAARESFSGGTDNSAALEEERRLFYVAMTRAKSRLYISYVESIRQMGAKPSRFIKPLISGGF